MWQAAFDPVIIILIVALGLLGLFNVMLVRFARRRLHPAAATGILLMLMGIFGLWLMAIFHFLM